MRVTKGHSANRRSHHTVKAPRLSLCSDCNEYYERHNVCKACGMYKGREVIKSKQTAVAVTTGDE